MKTMMIAPTSEHGPISWGGTIYQPGEAFECPVDKAKKLIANGKAEPASEPIIAKPKKVIKRKKDIKEKEREKKNANSD